MTELEAMRRALDLARRGWGRVHPNPMVGAVVLREGQPVGEGYHDLHHKFPWAFALGHRRFDFDLGKWFMLLCKCLGLIWGLKQPTKEQIETARQQALAIA